MSEEKSFVIKDLPEAKPEDWDWFNSIASKNQLNEQDKKRYEALEEILENDFFKQVEENKKYGW